MLESVNDLASKYFNLKEAKGGSDEGNLVLKEAKCLQEVFGNFQNLLVLLTTEELGGAQNFTCKALACGGAGPYGCYLRTLIALLNPISLCIPTYLWHLAAKCYVALTLKTCKLHASSLRHPTVS